MNHTYHKSFLSWPTLIIKYLKLVWKIGYEIKSEMIG